MAKLELDWCHIWHQLEFESSIRSVSIPDEVKSLVEDAVEGRLVAAEDDFRGEIWDEVADSVRNDLESEIRHELKYEFENPEVEDLKSRVAQLEEELERATAIDGNW